VPLAFPSHQGLILPLWRWWPERIDALALCVGAAMPDVIDATAWPFRGELGQWLGHSLLGVLVAVPYGFAVAWLVRRILPRRMIERLDRGPVPPRSRLRAAASLAIGALSHVAFDLVTHGNMVLFWPWYRNDHAFPSWWYHTWARVPLLVYAEPYPIAPHTLSWVAFSILGAWLFFRCLRAPRPVVRA
jgi:Domain of unknown function (DUF4184)